MVLYGIVQPWFICIIMDLYLADIDPNSFGLVKIRINFVLKFRLYILTILLFDFVVLAPSMFIICKLFHLKVVLRIYESQSTAQVGWWTILVSFSHFELMQVQSRLAFKDMKFKYV